MGTFCPKIHLKPKRTTLTILKSFPEFSPGYNSDCCLGQKPVVCPWQVPSKPNCLQLCCARQAMATQLSCGATNIPATVTEGLHLVTDQEWRKATAWPRGFEESLCRTTQPKINLSLSSLHVPVRRFSCELGFSFPRRKYLVRQKT